MLEKIEVKKEFDNAELCSRLRNVSLRGFSNVKIYRNSAIRINSLSPSQVQAELFTPQPCTYTPILKRINELSDLFLAKGIDIFNLRGGYDYTAADSKGEITDWTIIPPVVEVLPIKFNSRGLDYFGSLSPELLALMKEKGYELNPELQDLDYPEYRRFRRTTAFIPEICDGSHRVEVGRKFGLQTLVFITFLKRGFPYYAAPKPYSTVHEEPDREKSDKTHVLTSPGHKLLYRVFPSGGIQNGNVRPPTSKETFV